MPVREVVLAELSKGNMLSAVKFFTQNIKYLTLKPQVVDVVKESYKEAKQKECYRNAFVYGLRNSPATYVLGYVFILGIPIAHGWVKKNGRHLDVTLDPAKQQGYVSVLEMDQKVLNRYVNDEGYAPSLVALNIWKAESGGKKVVAAAPPKLFEHPLFAPDDYDYLRSKGYSDKDIKAMWDKDESEGYAQGVGLSVKPWQRRKVVEKAAEGEVMTFMKYRFRIDWIEERIKTNQIRFRREKEDITYWATKILGLKRDKPEHKPASLFMRIDYNHLKTITPERLKEPIIIVESPHGGIVIDGNHRLAKAYMEGIDELEAYIIPPSEFKKLDQPPGKRMRIKG